MWHSVGHQQQQEQAVAFHEEIDITPLEFKDWLEQNNYQININDDNNNNNNNNKQCKDLFIMVSPGK